MKRYYSSGKLMLSGEYAVLHGATSLSVPTILGQEMIVEELKDGNGIKWQSYDYKNKLWMDVFFDYQQNRIIKSDVGEELSSPLNRALQFLVKKNTIDVTKNWLIKNNINFPRDFGLGTSSTFIHNLAQFANVDSMDLFKETLTGSGFDVATAIANNAIHYNIVDRQPNWNKVTLSWDFTDELFFVHLNKKAISSNSIKREQYFDKGALDRITEISEALPYCNSLSEFEFLINHHEELISVAIGEEAIKRRLFHTFNGSIKSLGAWGGDFILVTGKKNYVEKYFKNEGFNSIFPFYKLVLKVDE